MIRNVFAPLLLLFASSGIVSASLVAITPTNSPFTGYTYLGMVVGPASSNDDLSAGSYNYDLLTGTNYAAAGAVPAAIGNAYDGGDAETSIWQFDSSDNITAQWTNTDGSAPASTLFYLPSANGVGITGDFSAFASAFAGGYQITLTYESLGSDGYIEAFKTSDGTDLGAISDQEYSVSAERLGLTTVTADRLLVDAPASAAPEPASFALFAGGIGLLVVVRKRFAN